MGSQFVDFNGDGHLDYLSATFDGSPHVALGSAQGFAEPKHILDAAGERILISSIWNYDAKKHETIGRAMGTDSPPKERCISALAFDWDGDGDHDLLLGSYENGHLYRQMNEGSNEEPKFTGKNIPVMAGEAPFAIPGKMTAPRLIDWDGDGDLDLIAGSFGDSYGAGGSGGGVYLSLNQGEKGNPAFAALETLIPPSKKGGTEPTRPDAGLYADAFDYDGDGDLDLIVGGYSMWKPEGRALSAAEEATVAALKKKQADLRERQSALSRRINEELAADAKGLQPDSQEYRDKRTAIYTKYRDQRSAMTQEFRSLKAQLDALVPSDQREAFVWLYERK